MWKKYSVFYIAFIFSGIVSADEPEPGLALSARAGTLGAGIELDYAINQSFNIRLQANRFSKDDTFEEDDIDYTGELDLSSVGLIADWRPFSGVFKLSGGVFSNGNKIAAQALSNGNTDFDIGDETYVGSSEDPLTLAAKMELGKGAAGYLGLGWGNSYSSGFSFSVDVGVLLSGSPTVTIAASGTAYEINNPEVQFDVAGNSPEAQAFRQEIELERTNLQEDLDEFKYYPVLSVGIGYRF